MQSIHDYILDVGKKAKEASHIISVASTRQKNKALISIADALIERRTDIETANQKDLAEAKASNLAPSMIERLELSPRKIESMIDGLRQVASLPDPVGAISDLNYRPSGIQVGRIRSPLGVIGIIYESRPNVTVDAAALCLKSGNAAILRGGSEAYRTNHVIAECIAEGLAAAGLPPGVIQVVDVRDRQAVGHMLNMPRYIDLIIPRGGRGLIERVSRESKIPVIKHLDGVCHIYVSAHADLEMAERITLNAKTYRYGICGTMETMLVDQTLASSFLPSIASRFAELGVELRGCSATQSHINVVPATERDWSTEYMAPILSIKIVSGMDEAVSHINTYGSHHTDAIVTENYTESRRFITQVDSASVMVNVPTCFADGYEYGLGAEIGISTDKIHVRGPVGLEALTSKKYVIFGEGEVRQ